MSYLNRIEIGDCVREVVEDADKEIAELKELLVSERDAWELKYSDLFNDYIEMKAQSLNEIKAYAIEKVLSTPRKTENTFSGDKRRGFEAGYRAAIIEVNEELDELRGNNNE